jgi:DNA polymerase I
MYNDPIIYGKESMEGIIGIEVLDDKAEILLQDGTSHIVPNYYWIVTNQAIPGWTRLQGNLHYKWGKRFDTLVKFYTTKQALKAKSIDFYAIGDEKESFMVKYGYTYYKGLHPKDISVLSFDIETTGLDHGDDSKILLISNTFRNNGVVTKKLFAYDEHETQGAMLKAWCDWVREVDPSIMLGHNIYSFDLPYMNYIAKREDLTLDLGRNGSPTKFFNYNSEKRVDGSRTQSYNKVRVYGREIIDTMFLAINYDAATKKYESYGLKKIIAQEGLEATDRTFYDAGQIRFNYIHPDEWAKIKAYCSDDSDDSLKLFDLMSTSYFYLTQSVPKSFQAMVESATGAQLNSMMMRAYIQEGHSIPKATEVYPFEGAISIGNPGIYRNAFKVDVSSLYPSIMIQYEIYDHVKDPKGYMFRMVKTFTAERLKNKKLAEETGNKYYDALQNAQKILINSMYGFMGAPGLLFNSPTNAALVTKYGREILQKSLAWASEKGFTIVNADTDSITISNNNEPIEEETRKELLAELNSLYPEKIRFADDGYYLSVIVLKAKNYILYGWDKKKQKNVIKTKGSALKDAKSEKALKDFMNDIIKSMIENTNHYDEIYNKYVKEILNVTDITRWASKKTISKKVLTSERTNESKIRDALADTEFSEGDKVYCYFKSDSSLGLVEKFDGDYDKTKLLEKLYKKALTFENIIPKDTFINYKLKRNQKLLEEFYER